MVGGQIFVLRRLRTAHQPRYLVSVVSLSLGDHRVGVEHGRLAPALGHFLVTSCVLSQKTALRVAKRASLGQKGLTPEEGQISGGNITRCRGSTSRTHDDRTFDFNFS